jgi:hypothetical protein
MDIINEEEVEIIKSISYRSFAGAQDENITALMDIKSLLIISATGRIVK